MDLKIISEKIWKLSASSLEKLEAISEIISFPKGEILFHQNKIETDIYFLKKGIVRAFSEIDGSQITFWFGLEGDVVLSMNSYVNKKPGYETIELLEDSEFYKIKTSKLNDLYLKDLELSNWGRKLAEQELIKVEKRLIDRQFLSASERYKQLLMLYPQLIKRVALVHIASFLGITAVSLSRIRSMVK
ncbi:cyclic nucleotide-binding domain-containing protein [Flavobacterium sp. NST-5]|uniref:Cyclic nucleotide-binding domain-containing protein n=1 Tax=Flavobacterium ichthyis TaxID=2698827 RepID=A0ABW9Z567_9FLAO|nr:Crp/Fnr family transcriptional regulator [Flavobacterium ichthyis]NBL63983.1 cyclic nucleotide-binding domain-containing protein [Flavobacterium ichthyis]